MTSERPKIGGQIAKSEGRYTKESRKRVYKDARTLWKLCHKVTIPGGNVNK
jgi:hypothetical protein